MLASQSVPGRGCFERIWELVKGMYDARDIMIEETLKQTRE